MQHLLLQYKVFFSFFYVGFIYCTTVGVWLYSPNRLECVPASGADLLG